MLNIDLSDLKEFTISGPFINRSRDVFGYLIAKNSSFNTTLDLSRNLETDQSFWPTINEKIKTLLFNEIPFERKVYNERSDILDFINSHYPRLNPDQKVLATLEYLYSLTNYDGQRIDLEKQKLKDENIWRRLFFNDSNELDFYIQSLNGSYINYKPTSYTYISLHLTINGLLKVGEYLESKNSNICFVAMSFDTNLFDVYDHAIEPAIIQCGFQPLIIRKEHVNSDVTINDAIIADIKKARFTIADFTFHKAGVYFEAGYALGRGQKVIYLCREDEIEKAHFDTRNYQHIVWKDPNNLKQQLIAKIEAFIKD
jgi:hypothetical protein